MGLWDILVPSEPGVLHNLIANPSFEYDNNEIDVARLNPPSGGSTVAEIASFRTLPANTGITYWTALKGAGVSRSSSWASRGSYSLKINAGASTNGGTVYDPRLSSPSPSVGVSVSQVVPSDNIPPSWSNIPASRQFHVAVFGLTDAGMALANGISDTQFYYNPDSQDIVAYPTMDAKRGHTTPYFASLPSITSNPGKSIKVVISGGQDSSANATIRGWAVWYSMDTTDVKRYVLASVVPASADTGTSTTVFIHKVINQVNVDTVLTPSLCTGKIYMYPFAVDGEYIVKGVGTSFLTECPAGTDLYVLADINQPNGEKQFLGRVADQGKVSVTDVGNTVSVTGNSATVTVSGVPTAPFLVGREIHTSAGVLIGRVVSASSNTSATLASNSTINYSGNYQYSVATQTEIRIQQKATTTPIGFDFYRMVSTNVQSYPDNPIGAISSFSCNPTSNTNFLPASMGINCSAPYFGITNNTFANNTYKHHLYLDWYLSSPNLINPNATYTDTGARWKVTLVNITSDAIQPVGLTITTQRGSLSATVSNSSGFVQGDCIYTTNYEFVGEIKTINGNNITFYNLAFISLTGSAFRKLAFNAGTVLGTLDASTATQLNAKRMGLRTKFLVTPPSGDTSRMQLRFQYTGTTSDADLFIDGVQFVDSGMIWRSYDYYSNSPSTYVNPPQFSDWNWDDVDFSYVDGDTPGAIWADTMPTQSGTYSDTFPYFTNDGVWHANFDEYDSSQSGHGMGTPRFRQQYQWRNEAKPVYGISVPGLSQSSLLTQTFTTGFWASLDTDNINVVVEPTISGTGMPEIATTALEYGITDGGFVQRQVARMRNMQFNVTISAKSWVGLHANRRSLINLLKFDQLAQQGERMLRYTGADTPVVTRITYVGGLEFSGVQTQSFTEVLGLRFLSADPYFYTEVPFTQDVSPTSTLNESASVYYKLGNTSEWTPLNFHKNEMVLTADELIANGESTPQLQSQNAFWNVVYSPSIPKAIGWLQSPSGNVSTLVVGGDFSYPFSTIAFFYVSGFTPDTKSPTSKVSFNTGLGTLTSTLGSAIVAFSDPEALTTADVGKFLFVGGDYLGKIASVQSSTQCTLTENALITYAVQPYQKVTLSTVDVNTNPAQVYGKQLFQLTGGSTVGNASVNAIYQESANSILVVGNFYQVIDFGDRTPNTNLNTSDVFVNDGKVNTTVRFGSEDISTQYPYFRIARFVMNDNGRIVAYPVDSQFEYDSVSNTYRSRLFNQIANQGLNSITQSPSGYTFVGGDVNTSIIPLDDTLTSDFAPYPAYRGPSAFARTSSQSNVYTINPNIVTQNDVTSLEYAGFVGYQLGISRFGTLTTNVGSHLVIVGSAFNSNGASFDGTPFTTADIGKLIFTDVGIYVGQIASIAGGATSSSVALLASPAQVGFSAVGFSVLGDIKSLTTDKKVNGANVFAVVDSSGENIEYRASLYAYVPNAKNIGKMSFVDGSTSVALVGSTFATALGTGNQGKIQCSVTSDVVKGDGTNFTVNMVGNYLTASDGSYIGQVKVVNNATQLTLTRNAFVDVGQAITDSVLSKFKGQVSVATNSKGVPQNTINGSSVTGQKVNFNIPEVTVGSYFYLYYSKNKTTAECGQIASFSITGNGSITLTTNSKSKVDSSKTVDGKSTVTNWIVWPTNAIYESFNVITNKIFTDGDGYLLRGGQLQTVVEESTVLPSAVAKLRTPSSYTTSLTQYLGTNYNAYTLYTSKGSDASIVNFDSLGSSLILNSIIRRQFDASSSVKATAYDPTISSDAVTGFGNVFASYSFGTIAPIFNDDGATGTFSVSGNTIAGITVSPNRHFYARVNERIVYFGKTSGTTNILSTNYYGNVTSGTRQWWSLPDTTNILPNANSTKLVKGIGTIKSNTNSLSGTGTFFSQYDVGRSVYTFQGNKWIFICVINGFTNTTIVTTTAQQYTWSGSIDYWLSGGSPVSSNNNVTWYPYQFAFPLGGQLDYEYLSNTAFGMETSSTQPTISGANAIINVINNSVPVGLKTNVYELYAYLMNTPPSINNIQPNVTGQWTWIGTISNTTANTITIPAFSSASTTITVSASSLNRGTLSSTSTVNAYQLIGKRVYRSTGVFVGVVEKALSNTVVQFLNNAPSAYTGTFYYMYNFPNYNSRGTPLCIVRTVTIQTNVPSSYQKNDELYTYASDSNSVLQYLGTIQQVFPVNNSIVEVSYMPYWANPNNIIDSSNVYLSGLTADSNGNVVQNTSGSATILKASKSLKASQEANYFADVIGIVRTVSPNPYNVSQTAKISWDRAADDFDGTIPSIHQVEPIYDATVNASANTNTLTFNQTVRSLSNTATVNTGFSYTLSGSPSTVQNKSLFRPDGRYMGSSTTDGTTGTLLFGTSNNANTDSSFAYMEYSSLGTVTFLSTASNVGTYTQNGGIALSVLNGKALFRASDGEFIGIVDYTYSTNGIKLLENAAVTTQNENFAYANASKPNLITASSSSTSVTVVGGGYSYGNASSVTQFSLEGRALFRYFAQTNLDNPFNMFIGNVTSVTQNSSTNTATLVSNSRINLTSEPFVHMAFSNTGVTALVNTTLTTAGNTINVALNNTSVTVAGTPSATTLVGSALYTSAGVFVGIVRSATSATSATLVEGAKVAVSTSVYRYSANPSATLVGSGFSGSDAVFRNTGELIGIRRTGAVANTFLDHPRYITTAASTYIYTSTSSFAGQSGVSNTITVAIRSRTVTVSGTISAYDLVGSTLYTTTGNIFIGVVESASSSTSATLVAGATTAVTASSYIYSYNLVGITSASTSSNIVTTIGSGMSLSSFIGEAIFTLGSPSSGNDWGYVYIGTVTDIGENQLILQSNSNVDINDSVGRVIIYAPTTVAMQLRTANQQSTASFSTISTTSGSASVTVYGQPDAYSLVGKTLFQSDGITSVGTVSSATSSTEAVLSSNAPATYFGNYQYTSSQSISPLVTTTNAPVSVFANKTAIWRTDGSYMGILGGAINSTQLNFVNMPYANTNNVDSYFIWADATNVENNDTTHVLIYGAGIANSITIGINETSGTYAGADILNVGYGIFDSLGEYIGKIASVNTVANSFTLTSPSRVNVVGSFYYYAPNPYLMVFNSVDIALSKTQQIINTDNTSRISVIDYASSVVGVTSSPEVFGTTRGQSSGIGNSYLAPYSAPVDNNKLRFIYPGDVIRTRDANDSNAFAIRNDDIVGQVVQISYNATGGTVTTTLPILSALSSQKVRVHRKHVNSEFIGQMSGTINAKITIGGMGGTQATIYGVGTRFTLITFDFLNKNNMNGTSFHVKSSTSNTWTKIGTIFSIVSDTEMIVTLSATTISDFASASFTGGYSMRSIRGVGLINITSTGIVRGESSGVQPIFNQQLYPGCVITVFSMSNLIPDGQYRVIDIHSDTVIQIANIDGSPYTGGLKSSRNFNIEYVYDEYPLIDTGLTTYTNQDWQPMGLTDGPINNITTTQNGTLIISGSFNSWIDASYVGTNANYNAVRRNVGNIAKITPLISDGKLFDAYASPIVGTSYNKNGFNGVVNVVQDITDINPINGYVGSGDKLLIGGGFTGSLNNESVTHGLAYAEGSTISGNLQTIVNADIVFPVNRSSLNTIRSQTTAIASTNRMRKYYTNPITNILDGISGSNVAIIHHGFSNNSVNVSTIQNKMQYFSLRIRGNASVYPIIRIRNNQLNRVIYELYQTETGARIRFDNAGLKVLAYEEITINLLPGQRSITSNIRGNMISFISPTSNFVDWVLLGANNSAGKYTQSYDDYRINVIGIHAQAGMNITVNYTPRFWSFDANNMFFGTTKAGL